VSVLTVGRLATVTDTVLTGAHHACPDTPLSAVAVTEVRAPLLHLRPGQNNKSPPAFLISHFGIDFQIISHLFHSIDEYIVLKNTAIHK